MAKKDTYNMGEHIDLWAGVVNSTPPLGKEDQLGAGEAARLAVETLKLQALNDELEAALRNNPVTPPST